MNINDTINKTVTVLHEGAEIQVVQTIKVTAHEPMGRKGVIWAVGVVVSTTHPTGWNVGNRTVIGPVA